MGIEIYNEADCRLVGEWASSLGLTVCFEGTFDFCKGWREHKHVPELIREALARDGVYESRQYDRNDEFACYFYLENEDRSVNILVDWSIKLDPTARHALFAATVEYLKRREG